MIDSPTLPLKHLLTQHFTPILAELDYPSEGLTFRNSNIDGVNFQSEIALRLAKLLKMPPREIATRIITAGGERLMHLGMVEVSGPGFINVRISNETLSQRVPHTLTLGRTSPANIMLDFGGPNVAKPMHVGHLRSAVIGDTLQRIFRFCGDKVVSDIHLGDWGLQMGHIITQLAADIPDLPHLNPEHEGPFPDPEFDMDVLAELYPKGSAAAKADKARMAMAQEAVAELQAGREGYIALISYCIALSIDSLKADYAFLNVHFDHWLGEKAVGPLVPEIIEAFKAKALTTQSDGALIIEVAKADENIPKIDSKGEEKVKNPMPPLILLNSRGSSGYHATDLATIYDRVNRVFPKLERIIYVVDQRQALHFEQVFRATEKVGWLEKDQLEFIGFGTVNGKDGKPFKTRAGGVLKLADLHQQAMNEAAAKIDEANLPADLTKTERAHIQKCVAIAAIRFADLCNTRTTNYVFDLEKFTKFQGKTGPYLLYQAVRIKSLLRQAGTTKADAKSDIHITTEAERDLALSLDGFEEAVLGAREKRMPHILCEYLFSLSQSFSAFYTENPILKAETKAIRNQRLALAAMTLQIMETGLDLIGLEIPDRM